jgi:F0F1-type ATP synthase membrane subunit a
MNSEWNLWRNSAALLQGPTNYISNLRMMAKYIAKSNKYQKQTPMVTYVYVFRLIFYPTNISFSHQWNNLRHYESLSNHNESPSLLCGMSNLICFTITFYPVRIHGKANYLIYFIQQVFLCDVVFYASHHL